MKYAVVIAHVWFCFILSSGTSNTDDNLPMSRHLEVFTFTKLHGFNKSTLLSSSVKGSEHMQLWTQIINIKKSDKTSVDWFKVDLQLFNMTELSVTTFAYFFSTSAAVCPVCQILSAMTHLPPTKAWNVCWPSAEGSSRRIVRSPFQIIKPLKKLNTFMRILIKSVKLLGY